MAEMDTMPSIVDRRRKTTTATHVMGASCSVSVNTLRTTTGAQASVRQSARARLMTKRFCGQRRRRFTPYVTIAQMLPDAPTTNRTAEMRARSNSEREGSAPKGSLNDVLLGTLVLISPVLVTFGFISRTRLPLFQLYRSLVVTTYG